MNRFICDPDNLALNNSSIHSFSQKLSDISLYILPILALAGNSLTLLVFWTSTQLNQSSFSVYVKSMAISDTLVLLFKLFSYLNKTLKSIYFPSLCTVLVFCCDASALISIWIIVFITIERTLVVLFPLHTKKLVSVCRARILIVTIAVVMVIFSARTLFVPIETNTDQKKRCYPSADWQSYIKLNATISEFTYCYIPLTIVVIGNIITLYTVKRAGVHRQRVLTNNSYRKKEHITNLNENQLMLMLFVVTLMFIVYFVPYTITNVIARWGLPFHLCFTQKMFDVYQVIRAFSVLLKDFNFCTNFIIYCISGRRFRYALIALIRGQPEPLNGTSRYGENSRQIGQRLLQMNSERRSMRALTRVNTMEESQF